MSRLGAVCRIAAPAVALWASACSGAGPTESVQPTAGPSRTPIQLGPTSTVPASTPTSTPPPPAPTSLPLPEISPSDWSLGPLDAPATLLVYADFQSPGSVNVLRDALQLADAHPEGLRLVFRHNPLIPSFDKDSLAGQAVEAAGTQGEFWRMTRALVERHAEWSVQSPADFRLWLIDLADELGLEVSGFRADLDHGRYAAFMLASYEDALASGLPGPPVLFLNSLLFRVPPTRENLEAAVRLEILASQSFAERPAQTIREGADYFATLVMDEGEIVIQLLPESAPMAVNSFVFLARQDWFDGTAIYLVVPSGWVEAGDPSGTGLGDAGYHLPDEIDPARTFDEPGVVALASVGPDTGGSRFLITLAPLPALNGTRTIFGRVVRGLELLQGLPARDPTSDLLAPGALIMRDVLIEVEP
jgi:cyclophilin family peptidyl-prolyl cis-trans isomerase/protein-disulfide isomerase